MTRLALDWSDGPIACAVCGRPLRPAHMREADAVGVWAGTLRHEGGGRCATCYKRSGPGTPPPEPPDRVAEQRAHRPASARTTTAVTPPVGESITVVWEALDADLPLAHQEMEAMAELADHLRARGLVLCARPYLRLTHGRPATITMACRVRPAAGGEADVLARPVRAAS